MNSYLITVTWLAIYPPPYGGCSPCSASCEICKERCSRYDEFILEICISTPVCERVFTGKGEFLMGSHGRNSIQLYSNRGYMVASMM